MKVGKKVVAGIMIFSILISISFVSAGFWGDLFTFGEDGEGLEGELAEIHHAEVSIQNDPPEILDIEITTSLIPDEDDGTGTTTTSVPAVQFVVYDSNGLADLPQIGSIVATGYIEHTPNTAANYVAPADTQRSFTGADCVDTGVVNTNIAPYNKPVNSGRRYVCNVDILYYDDSVDWDVVISTFEDSGANSASNEPYSELAQAQIGERDGFYTTENTLTWSSISSNPDDVSYSTGVQSTGNVILINTGNRDFDNSVDDRTFKFQGRDLIGHDTSTDIITANNFMIHTDAPANCMDSVEMLILGDQTEFQHNHAVLPNGKLADAQEELNFCMIGINPGLSGQTYSTTVLGTNDPWVIGYGPVV